MAFMINRLKRIINKQIVRYVCVGGFTTSLDLVLYWFMVDRLNVKYIFAASLISPFTLGLNYSLHRLLTFESEGKSKIQIFKYLGLVLFNYVAGIVLLYVFVDVFKIDYFWARIIVFCIIILWNFNGLKHIVFK